MTDRDLTHDSKHVYISASHFWVLHERT